MEKFVFEGKVTKTLKDISKIYFRDMKNFFPVKGNILDFEQKKYVKI